MKIETISIDFTDEQKRYLEGFSSGLQVNRAGRGLGGTATKVNAEPTGPDAAPDPTDLEAGGKAFEIAFLLVGKVD